MEIEQPSQLEPDTRAGHVALVGRPNVGKSTLLNALVGEKLSIVTARAQTTRERVFGILTTADAQIIFVDTPGLLEPKYRLQRSMLHTALAALGDADVALLLLDGTQPEEVPSGDVVAMLSSKGRGLLCAVNKLDQAEARSVSKLQAWAQAELDRDPFRCSALTGEGLAELQAAMIDRLPRSPFLYPVDDLAVQPVRFFVEELVRETIFERFEQEVPYSTVVRIEEFKEDREPVYIRATIYVERDSQKPILLGKGGSAIRELGREARAKIEAFVGRPVYLDLWVKSMPGWRNKASALKFLGYAVPEDDVHG
jgi:GTP-binding protein Era